MRLIKPLHCLRNALETWLMWVLLKQSIFGPVVPSVQCFQRRPFCSTNMLVWQESKSDNSICSFLSILWASFFCTWTCVFSCEADQREKVFNFLCALPVASCLPSKSPPLDQAIHLDPRSRLSVFKLLTYHAFPSQDLTAEQLSLAIDRVQKMK